MKWKDDLSVGVIKFDAQHKQLVGLVDDLHRGIREEKDKYDIGAILDKLLEYTSKHFLAEEMDMIAYGYDEYEEHKKEHDDLKLQVKEFYSNYYSGNIVLKDDIMNFVVEWLSEHIAKTDRKYGPFFNSKGLK